MLWYSGVSSSSSFFIFIFYFFYFLMLVAFLCSVNQLHLGLDKFENFEQETRM